MDGINVERLQNSYRNICKEEPNEQRPDGSLRNTQRFTDTVTKYGEYLMKYDTKASSTSVYDFQRWLKNDNCPPPAGGLPCIVSEIR